MNYAETVEQLERRFPKLASTYVPAGMTRYWVSVLAPKHGDESVRHIIASPAQSREIRLADDLRIIGELLSEYGAETLLALMLELPRFPRDTGIMAAPDLRSALLFAEQSLLAENPHFSMRFELTPHGGVISASFHESLGAFIPFLELGFHLFVYRIILSFVRLDPHHTVDPSRLRLEFANADKDHVLFAGNLLGCEVRQTTGQSLMHVPQTFLGVSNLEHDPQIWSLVKESIATPRSNYRGAESRFGRERMIELIDDIIEKERCVPNLPRLAAEFGISQRSFSRKLSQQGLTMTGLLKDWRIQAAERCLVKEGKSVAHTSELLGYSDPSSFVRAFMSWKGASPLRWRQHQRAASSNR